MTDDIIDPAELRQYLERLELNMQAVRRRLKRFEDEFGMNSDQFYARHTSGALNPRIEYSEWAGEHEMMLRLKKQHEDIKRKLEQ